MHNYRGFTSRLFLTDRKLLMGGTDLINQDLTNHILTVLGEVPHDPGFGSKIPIFAFEALTEANVQSIKEEFVNIINSDPRVVCKEVAVTALPDNNTIVLYADIYYKDFDVDGTLKIEL